MHELAGMIKKSVEGDILYDPACIGSPEASDNDSQGVCPKVLAVQGFAV